MLGQHSPANDSRNSGKRAERRAETIHWLACTIRGTTATPLSARMRISEYLDHCQSHRKCSSQTVLYDLSSYHSNPIQSITLAYYRNCLTYLGPFRFLAFKFFSALTRRPFPPRLSKLSSLRHCFFHFLFEFTSLDAANWLARFSSQFFLSSLRKCGRFKRNN